MTSVPRFTRQERLAEVGAAGQARIARARLAPRSRGLAGEIEALYLAGAGVGTLVVADAAVADAARALVPEVLVHANEDEHEGGERESGEHPTRGASLADAHLADALPRRIAELVPGAREVGEGAWRALVALRFALEAA